MKNKSKVFTATIGLFSTIILIVGCSAGESGKIEKVNNSIKEGSTVTVHYTLTVAGDVVDSSVGGDPIRFQAGLDQLVPGFEKAVMGMKAGDKKSFEVAPEEGYGPINPESFKEIPRDRLAPDIKPESGMTLYAKGSNGEIIPVKITEVKEESVVLDFNHPLAGKTLRFDVEIIDVK